MKKIIKTLYKKIGYKFNLLEKKSNSSEVLYKIGNIKKHNTLVDTLIPQAVIIGDNFVSAPNSIILAHDASTYIHSKKHRIEPTKIGNNVFLGAGAIVLPGIEIGDGAIIGAGAIVTKNVETFTVVAGNPAKYICSVEEYIEKCKKKNVLFNTPDSFNKIFNNGLEPKDVKEFQDKYILKNKNEKDI